MGGKAGLLSGLPGLTGKALPGCSLPRERPPRSLTYTWHLPTGVSWGGRRDVLLAQCPHYSVLKTQNNHITSRPSAAHLQRTLLSQLAGDGRPRCRIQTFQARLLSPPKNCRAGCWGWGGGTIPESGTKHGQEELLILRACWHPAPAFWVGFCCVATHSRGQG